MARLVSLLGRSPGTVHTVVCKLLEKGYKVDSVTVVTTQGGALEEALQILAACPCAPGGGPPDVAVEAVTLPFEDIEAEEQLAVLRETLSRLLGPDTVLDITGGRKLMAVAAALEALNKGATIASAIVPQEEYRRMMGEAEPCAKTLPQKARLLILL